MIDFKSLDYKAILETYSVRNISVNDDEIQFSCIFDGHKNNDAHPSCSLNTDKGTFYCFGCQAKGTIVDWVAKADGITKQVAEQWILNDFKGKEKKKSLSAILDDAASEKPSTSKNQIPESYLKIFEVDWDYVYSRLDEAPKLFQYIFRRGFTVETLKEWDFGYDKHSNRLTFPIRDNSGTLVGFKGRSLLQEPKYLLLGDRPDKEPYYGFRHHKNADYIFGLHNAGPVLIVCEGEFDAIKLRQEGFLGAVGLGGSSVTQRQLDLIRRNADAVYLALDADEAGKKAEQKLMKGLSKYCIMRVIELPEGTDPSDHSLQEFNTLYNDAVNPLQIRNTQGGN